MTERETVTIDIRPRTPLVCSETISLDLAADCSRDVYTKCTLPAGHDGVHRGTYEDDWQRIVVTFEKKEYGE